MWLPVCVPAYQVPLQRHLQKGKILLPMESKYFLLEAHMEEKKRPRSACSSAQSARGIIPLRKHACSNILKLLPPKNENFQIKNSIFHISAQNIDCGFSLEPPRRGGGGSNAYPQYMVLNRNKKNNVYPCKPQFYYIKVEFTKDKII